MLPEPSSKRGGLSNDPLLASRTVSILTQPLEEYSHVTGFEPPHTQRDGWAVPFYSERVFNRWSAVNRIPQCCQWLITTFIIILIFQQCITKGICIIYMKIIQLNFRYTVWEMSWATKYLVFLTIMLIHWAVFKGN